MKAIICAIGPLQIYSFGNEWTKCPCGESAARWLDAEKGIMQATVKYQADRTAVKLFGLNNQMLGPMMHARGQVWDFNRELHEIATNAPGYIFDKSRAGCWAVIALIGTTTDSSWIDDEETKVMFGP